jgi:hypothetical protein
MASSELVLAALAYAERGWPVLPVLPAGKRPLTKTGLLEADTDPHQIAEWWSRWPHANIGLRTGVAFDVLDIDGIEGFASIPEAHSGPISRTGKGEHWLFLPGATANATGLFPKVDWRGTNGYIVAPPSRHPDGHDYAWHPEQGPDSPLSPPPEWLTPLLSPWIEKENYATVIRVLKTNPYSSNAPQRILAYGADRLAALLTDIVATATDLGLDPRPDGGGRYHVHCPFHEGDREASMKLYTHDNSFYCFGCGAWGDAKNLIDHRPGGHRAKR